MADQEQTCPCDTCGKMLRVGDMLYSVASKWDEETGRWISGRHWTCHVPIEDRLASLKTEVQKIALRTDDIQVQTGLSPRARRPR